MAAVAATIAAIVAAVVAAAISNGRRFAGGDRLAARLCAATISMTAEQTGLSLRLKGELGDPSDRHSQHQANQIAFHQEVLQKSKGTMFPGPTASKAGTETGRHRPWRAWKPIPEVSTSGKNLYEQEKLKKYARWAKQDV
jgi:hypothetical protein